MAARVPVDAALELLGSQIRMEGVDVSLQVEDGLDVLGDRAKLEQVFVNLISNARDAVKDNSAESGRRIAICLYSTAPEPGGCGRVVFTVRDNGPGVEQQVRGQIFEPFYSGKGREEGTGLGLSVTREIVEGHGGGIELGGDDEQGATFRVWLPELRHA